MQPPPQKKKKKKKEEREQDLFCNAHTSINNSSNGLVIFPVATATRRLPGPAESHVLPALIQQVKLIGMFRVKGQSYYPLIGRELEALF